MLFDDIQQDALPFLPSVPEGGMIYYLQTHCFLRGRVHQNSFFCTFNGGEKEVPAFFNDQNTEIMLRLLLLQSWDVFMVGYWFVKLFPPPYVVQFAPFPQFGFWPEDAAPSKALGHVSFQTAQTGRRRFMRKYLFGLPASWIDGEYLTPEAHLRVFARLSAWEQMWHTDYTDWPYTMGKMNRYIDGSYRSPLNPINYWPLDRMNIKKRLMRHYHPDAR
jgi:hypothetical protein